MGFAVCGVAECGGCSSMGSVRWGSVGVVVRLVACGLKGLRWFYRPPAHPAAPNDDFANFGPILLKFG